MGWMYELRDPSGRVAGEFWLGDMERSYVHPDGRTWSMMQAAAWCGDCGAYVAAERVPSLERIDAMIAAADGGLDAFLSHLRVDGARVPHVTDAVLWERVRAFARLRWRDAREWRVLRESPLPHCLACFSTDVSLVPEHADEVVHPLTRERLAVACRDHRGMNDHWKYTIEGLPLEVTVVVRTGTLKRARRAAVGQGLP